MTFSTIIDQAAADAVDREARERMRSEDAAARALDKAIRAALAVAQKVITYERCATVVQGLMPVAWPFDPTSGGTRDRIDHAARLVHSDHDRFAWDLCGEDECRALQDAWSAA